MSLLDQIRIASPCSADWDAMPGDARVRRCGDCRKRVYNLAELTRAEAEALIIAHEGELCVRLYRRRDATIVTADCLRPRRSIRRSLQVAGAAVALATGCVAAPEDAEDSEDTQAIEANGADEPDALFPLPEHRVEYDGPLLGSIIIIAEPDAIPAPVTPEEEAKPEPTADES